MKKLNIICIDDQRSVLTTIVQNLSVFESHCNVEECESADEAFEVLDDLDAEGAEIALVISDHVMPGRNGVTFLTELKKDSRFKLTKKILLTGLATHQDTITAINSAGIDQYIEKPWEAESLTAIVKRLLTLYLLQAGLDYQQYNPILDQETLLENLRNQTG